MPIVIKRRRRIRRTIVCDVERRQAREVDQVQGERVQLVLVEVEVREPGEPREVGLQLCDLVAREVQLRKVREHLVWGLGLRA